MKMKGGEQTLLITALASVVGLESGSEHFALIQIRGPR
jgi:hypothetical protein